MAEAIAELEHRVISRYSELVAQTIPNNIFNPEEWLYGTSRAAPQSPPDQQFPREQFPREQWVTYPNRRAIALIIVDRSLDRWDTLTQEQRWQIDFLMAYGGRERIA